MKPDKGLTTMTAEQFRRQFGADRKITKPQIRIPVWSTPNATEAEYGILLEKEFPPLGHITYKVEYETITFRLPSGTRYTPDWVVWSDDRIVLVVETKGPHIHSSASIRAFKEAVAAFPHLTFRFAQKRQGEWTKVEV